MKTSAGSIGFFIAVALLISCSQQEEEFFKEGPDLKSREFISTDTSPDIRDRYIVVFKNQVTQPAAEAGMLHRKFGFEMGHVYENVFRGFSASIPEQALNGLRNHPMIDFIEPDIVMHTCAQTIPTGIRRIGADLNLTANINGIDDRVNVTAAVIDTGIDKDHPDLNVVGGVRFYLGLFTDSKYDDDNGHGSHVAGIIGAKDNGEGVVGVAPGTRLYAVKVLNSRGSGYLSDIIKGLDWVRSKSNEIEVVNMSLGGQGLSSAYQTAIRNCVNAGIVVVVAAGNEKMDVFGKDGTFGTSDDIIPAAYPEAAAISAMADSDGQPGGSGPGTSYGPDDSFATFSNFSHSIATGNPVYSPGYAIDLLLPGVSILSCYKDMNYATMSGTSMASPHAAGLAALYIAEHGRASDADGVYVIRQALIDAGKAQGDASYGLAVLNDPDPNEENLGWAGTGTAPVNNPPIAAFDYSASGLTVSFTDKSTDDGTITGRSWDFGDESTSDVQNPVHTYASAGTYEVTLTVTDNGGLTGQASQSVKVTSPSTENIVLSATSSVVKNRMKVTLTWIPATSVADIYRDGRIIAASVTSGTYTDNVKSGLTYRYQVKSGDTWSNEVTVP